MDAEGVSPAAPATPLAAYKSSAEAAELTSGGSRGTKRGRRATASATSASGPPAAEPAEPSAADSRGAPGSGDVDEDEPAEEVVGDDVVGFNPTLHADCIAQLRRRQQLLKQEQAKIRNEMRLKQRKRQRIVRRMKNLDTGSVLQVLLERGVDLNATMSGARPSLPPTSAPSVPASPPEE